MKLVLGLTGSNAAGKGEVSAYLAGRGFVVHSLSDVLRDEAGRRGSRSGREELIRLGNELRAQEGPGVLAERVLPRLGERDVVDSIRNPAEVEVLRRLPHFVLLGIRAPQELRFRRAAARARPGDPATLDEFRRREEQENSDRSTAQQLDATFRLADRIIDNRGDVEGLHAAMQRLLEELEELEGSTN